MDRPPSKPVGVRLGLPQEDRWLDLVYGVRVCVRPLTTAIYEAAQFTGQRQVLAVAIEHCLLEDVVVGARISDIPNLRDRDHMAGVSQMLFGMALGVHGIVAWENVFDADGQPLPLGEEAVREMLRTHPVLAGDFVAKYTAPLTEAIVEGNGSGAAPTGTPAAARGSAKTAGTSTTAKPAGGNRKTRRANARTSGTPRKRSTAS